MCVVWCCCCHQPPAEPLICVQAALRFIERLSQLLQQQLKPHQQKPPLLTALLWLLATLCQVYGLCMLETKYKVACFACILREIGLFRGELVGADQGWSCLGFTV